MNEQADNRLYLLGALRLQRRGSDVAFPRRKAASLLAYLVLHPFQHSRDELATLLWGDFVDDEARASLRTTLSTVRRLLGEDVFITEAQTIQLNPTFPLWVDAAAFADYAGAYLREPGFDLSPAFLDLYQGDLLPDMYDDWIGPQRDRLRDLYLDVLLQAAQQMRSRSEYERAASFARRVLNVEPANERAHQHLMFCHIALGDRSAAIRQYEACRQALQQDLAVEPMPETTALCDWIRGQPEHERAREARITNLPIPLTSFIGREREMMEVKRLLAERRLVTISGPGGCGKTRLALQAAGDLLDAYKDGVWFVDLAGLQAGALVPNTVARVLGAPLFGDQPPVEAVAAFLRLRRTLLVLDNCEHLASACAGLVQTILSTCPDVRILATSRQPLAVPGEVVWTTPPLSTPDAGATPSLADLSAYEATRLFVERTTTGYPGFALHEHDAAAVASVCTQLDGMPLAIELAAARAPGMGVQQMAGHLHNRFRLLAAGGQARPPRQQSLQATIAWSYELLPPDEKAMLRRVSVFRGGFCADGAAAVYGEDTTEAVALDLLARLVDQSLIIAEEREGVTRYRLLETVRMYGWELLAAAGEQETVVRRFVRFMSTWLFGSFGYTFYRCRTFRPAVHRFDLEHENLRAAVTWSRQTGQTAEGLCIMGAWDYWMWRGEDQTEFQQYLQATQSAVPPDLRSQNRFLYLSAALARQSGDLEAARAYAQRRLELVQASNNPVAVANAWTWLGKVNTLREAYEEAAHCFERAHAEGETGDWDPFTSVLEGELLAKRGDLDRSWEFFARAIASLASEEPVYLRLWAIGFAYTTQAQIALSRHDYSDADQLGRKAVQRLADMEHRGGLPRAGAVCAMAAANLGHAERAARLWGAVQRGAGYPSADVTGAMAAEYNAVMDTVRTRLGAERYERLSAEGRAMSYDQLITYVLDEDDSTEARAGT